MTAQVAPPWPPLMALWWLRDERDRGSQEWRGMCAGAAAHAFGFTSSGNNANDWAKIIPRSIRRYGPAPAGMLEFWLGGEHGHVSYTLGGGWLLCNTPNGSIGRMRESYYSGIGPSFWVDPREHKAAIFRDCRGVNTDKVRTPKPPANHIVARPGKRSPAVPVIRRALGGKSSSTFYGSILKRRVLKWKRAHGIKPDNGIIRRHLLDRIRSGK